MEVVMLLSILRSLTSLLACLLFANSAWATTTTQAMNVSGQGSDYIFVFRGNDAAFYDALVAYNPVGWTAVCHQTEPCAGTYYTISVVVQVDTQSLYLYVVDANGNPATPDSGAWYYFTNDPYPPAPPPTPVYGSSAPTTAQQSRMDAKLVAAQAGQGHTVEANIMGDTNSIYIDQAGTLSYINLMILGNTNSFTATQNMGVGVHAYNETAIIGNNNNVNLLQTGTGNKAAFINVTGDSNTASVTQKDSGEHFVQLDITGDNHTAAILQEGSGNHNATVQLDGSQPWNFDLTQSGATSQTYTLPHAMSDGASVSGTCSAVGGCNLTVNQQ
jgi:hypothetical protein